MTTKLGIAGFNMCRTMNISSEGELKLIELVIDAESPDTSVFSNYVDFCSALPGLDMIYHKHACCSVTEVRQLMILGAIDKDRHTKALAASFADFTR